MIINHVVCFWKEELRPVLMCRQCVWPVSEDRRGCMKNPRRQSPHTHALSHRKASFDQTSREKTPRDASKVNVISQKNRNECPRRGYAKHIELLYFQRSHNQIAQICRRGRLPRQKAILPVLCWVARQKIESSTPFCSRQLFISECFSAEALYCTLIKVLYALFK